MRRERRAAAQDEHHAAAQARLDLREDQPVEEGRRLHGRARRPQARRQPELTGWARVSPVLTRVRRRAIVHPASACSGPPARMRMRHPRPHVGVGATAAWLLPQDAMKSAWRCQHRPSARERSCREGSGPAASGAWAAARLVMARALRQEVGLAAVAPAVQQRLGAAGLLDLGQHARVDAVEDARHACVRRPAWGRVSRSGSLQRALASGGSPVWLHRGGRASTL